MSNNYRKDSIIHRSFWHPIPNLPSWKFTAAVNVHSLISSFRRHAKAVNAVSSTLVASQSSSQEHPTHRCYWITVSPFLCCSPVVAAVVKLQFAARLSSPPLPIFSSLSRSLLPKFQLCCSPFVAAVAKLQLASTLIAFATISQQGRCSPHFGNWSPFIIALCNIYDAHYWAM